MLLAIGSGNISLSQIINILPENQPQLDNAQVSKKIKSPTSGIEVLGVGDLLTKIAICCNPIPGDSIIGFITRSTGVTVHIKSCINILNENEKERLIPVNWREQQPAYPVDIKVESWDKVGLLNSITSVVSNEQINIGSCVSQEYDGFSTINLNIFVNLSICNTVNNTKFLFSEKSRSAKSERWTYKTFCKENLCNNVL